MLWWITESPRLSRRADRDIRGAEAVFVSAVSAYEIAQKVRLGNLPEAEKLIAVFERAIEAEGFLPLPLLVNDARHAGMMPGEHRDPFDRLLAAQALMNELTLISSDTVFDRFGVSRVW